MLFFAPFIWLIAVPALFVLIVLIRMLFWLRSLGQPEARGGAESGQPFIEGEFVEDEEPADHSVPTRTPLEK